MRSLALRAPPSRWAFGHFAGVVLAFLLALVSVFAVKTMQRRFLEPLAGIKFGYCSCQTRERTEGEGKGATGTVASLTYVRKPDA